MMLFFCNNCRFKLLNCRDQTLVLWVELCNVAIKFILRKY